MVPDPHTQEYAPGVKARLRVMIDQQIAQRSGGNRLFSFLKPFIPAWLSSFEEMPEEAVAYMVREIADMLDVALYGED